MIRFCAGRTTNFPENVPQLVEKIQISVEKIHFWASMTFPKMGIPFYLPIALYNQYK